MSTLKPLSEIDLEKLPLFPALDYFTLRETIKRGVKLSYPPWQISRENPGASDKQIQVLFDETVEKVVDNIMLVLVHNYFNTK